MEDEELFTVRRFIYMEDYTRCRQLKFITFDSIGMVYPFDKADVPYIKSKLENSPDHTCMLKNCLFKYVETRV